ncbi:MAG TPA: hypothetical protein VGH81_14975 [Rudaea sp.]|jgi:hypothetical protein
MIATPSQVASNSASSTPWEWIAALQVWLTLGVAAVVCFPVLRDIDPTFGWLPFWLVVTPAIDLAFLRRRQIGTWMRISLSRYRTRRVPRRQARSWHRRGERRLVQSTARLAAAANQPVMPRRLRSIRRRNSPMMR